jgi:hypothetical protein
LACASATTKSTSLLVVGTNDAQPENVLLEGIICVDTNISTSNIGDIVYLSEINLGKVTTTAPTGSGDIVRILGYVYDPGKFLIYFSPDKSWIEIS